MYMGDPYSWEKTGVGSIRCHLSSAYNPEVVIVAHKAEVFPHRTGNSLIYSFCGRNPRKAGKSATLMDYKSQLNQKGGVGMKKLLAVLLVVVLLAGVLSACGQDKTKESDPTGSGDPAGASEEIENFNETGLPIVNEPVTLTAVFASNELTDDINTLPMFQKLAEETNINIDWEIVRSGWDEKKASMLASGDLPDIIWGKGITDADIVNNKDFFVDMAPYIDEYCPNLQNVFTEVPEVKKTSLFPDGEIYGLPYIGGLRPSCNEGFIINKTWLDNLDLQVPTTLDEFADVLRAFKNEDPNGNGQNDEIPFNFSTTTDYEWFGSKIMIGAFGKMFDMTDNYMMVNDGVCEYMPTSNEYKELVKYLNQLYSEGLIYNEAFTQDYGKWVSLGQSQEAPVLGATFGWTKETMMGQWADQYIYIEPLSSDYSDTTYWSTNYYLIKYDTNHFEVTYNNQHVKETMRWIDLCYDPEMSLQLYFGTIGDCIAKNDDDTYTILDSSDPQLDQDSWNWKNAPKDYAACAVLPSIEEKLIPPAALADKIQVSDMYTPYLPAQENVYPSVKFTEDEQNEITVTKADLLQIVQQKYAEWITGGGIDEEWDNYVEQLDKIGLAEYTNIFQAAYDRVQ